MAICLKSVAKDHPSAVIGLFDRDAEGAKEYKLNKNFKEVSVGGFDAKVAIHGKAYATLLPIPAFRKECGEYNNLPIEYIFPDDYLQKQVNGQGLRLQRMIASRKVGKKDFKFDLPDFTHFKEIKSGKTEFAEIVVPALPEEAFEGFHAIFSLILAAIEHDKDAKKS